MMQANHHDKNYADLLLQILEHGERVPNRTGVDTISLIGTQTRYDLSKGFPATTLKKLYWKKAMAEMLWFLSGDCRNIDGLVQTDHQGREVDARNIWEAWADEDGNTGPIYGVQWRSWVCAHYTEELGTRLSQTDQLEIAMDQIKAGSDSRRIIVNGWQPAEIDEMALPPCHVLHQFTVRNQKLHLQLYQRSCDLPIGGPFNVFAYAAYLMMASKLAGLEPGTFIHTIHDAHIYVDQIEGVKRMIDNAYNYEHKSPELVIHGAQLYIDDFKLHDFELKNYESCKAIKFPVAV